MAFIKLLIISLFLLLNTPGQAQQVEVVKFPALEKRLSQPNDTTYVVIFWATWCGPCIKELPYFEQANKAYTGQKVKVLLVSLDYASQLDKKVKPFVQKRGLKSEVLLLNETDPNTWLGKVDDNWSGAIPFTLMLKNKKQKRAGFEQEFTQAELTAQLTKFLR